MQNQLIEDEALKLVGRKVHAVQNQLERLRASMIVMLIKEKILKMIEKKKMKALVEKLREEQQRIAQKLEPLPEEALQQSQEAARTHVQVKVILK